MPAGCLTARDRQVARQARFRRQQVVTGVVELSLRQVEADREEVAIGPVQRPEIHAGGQGFGARQAAEPISHSAAFDPNSRIEASRPTGIRPRASPARASACRRPAAAAMLELSAVAASSARLVAPRVLPAGIQAHRSQPGALGLFANSAWPPAIALRQACAVSARSAARRLASPLEPCAHRSDRRRRVRALSRDSRLLLAPASACRSTPRSPPGPAPAPRPSARAPA